MPLAKEEFAEYQRLRRSAKYPGMGCGEVGRATERYKSSAAAAEIRCCQECHRKITAALQPDKATPALAAATPAPPIVGLPDTYEAMAEGLTRDAMTDRARELVFGTKQAPKGKRDKFSTVKPSAATQQNFTEQLFYHPGICD